VGLDQVINATAALKQRLRAELVAGVPKEDLPGNEKLCREVRRTPEERWPELWKVVLVDTKASSKAMPNVRDVTAAAWKLESDRS
jgi:hypothetical protein